MALNNDLAILKKIKDSLSFADLTGGTNVKITKSDDGKVVISAGNSSGSITETSSKWEDIENKPFESLDENSFNVENGKLIAINSNDGSNVTASENNGNIKVDDVELKVYDDTLIQTDIANLNERSVIGKYPKSYYAYGLGNNISVTATMNLLTLFTKVQNSEMEVNSDGYVKLEKGKKWIITVNIYRQTADTGISCSLKDSTGKQFGQTLGYFSKGECGTGSNVIHTSVLLEDKYIGLFMSDNSTISTSLSSINIVEDNSTFIVDPVEYAQEHEIGVSTFYIDSNKNITANAPLVFDRAVGSIALNENGYIKLTGGKSYIFSASVYNNSNTAIMSGIKIYDVTNSNPDLLFLGVNGHSTGTVTYTPETDIIVSLCFGKYITLYYNYTYLTIQEIKNPVMVNYHSMGFDKTLLFEGEANSADTTYDLIDSVDNYDEIRIYAKVVNSEDVVINIPEYVISNMEIGVSQYISCPIFGNNGSLFASACIVVNFNTETSFKIGAILLYAWKKIYVYKVIGIKGKDNNS